MGNTKNRNRIFRLIQVNTLLLSFVFRERGAFEIFKSPLLKAHVIDADMRALFPIIFKFLFAPFLPSKLIPFSSPPRRHLYPFSFRSSQTFSTDFSGTLFISIFPGKSLFDLCPIRTTTSRENTKNEKRCNCGLRNNIRRIETL